MGRRGPKGKPTALKLLEGCRADRINAAEPEFPAAGDHAAPVWLDRYGREHWDELSAVLRRAGVLTEGDLAALAQLCDDYSIIRRSLDPPDAEVVGDYDRMRSLMTNADRARERYKRMLVEFGLTPSSRSRLKAAPERPKDEVQALDEFLGGRKAQ